MNVIEKEKYAESVAVTTILAAIVGFASPQWWIGLITTPLQLLFSVVVAIVGEE